MTTRFIYFLGLLAVLVSALQAVPAYASGSAIVPTQVNASTFCWTGNTYHNTVIAVGGYDDNAGTGIASFNGGPTHTCANNYNYNFFTLNGGSALASGTYTIIEYDDLNANSSKDTGEPAYYYTVVWNGTTGTLVTGPDAVSSTHVLAITQPAPLSTTTNTFAVAFDIFSASSTPPDGYTISYTNNLTRATYYQYGWLVDSGFSSSYYETSFHVATSSTLALNGTYTMNVRLWASSSGPDLPINEGNFRYANPYCSSTGCDTQVFSVNVADNVQTFGFTGPTQQTFASTTCAINFLGTFNLSDCLGYLFIPSTASSSPLSNLRSLSLANSFPFAYAYQVGAVRQELFDSPATASSTVAVTVPNFGTLTFLSASLLTAVPFATTIRTILGWLMWLLLVDLIYVTVLRSHNTNTHV